MTTTTPEASFSRLSCLTTTLVILLAALGQLWWLLPSPAGSPLTDFPLDDAWIHLVYVRGLLTDGLPTYNPGDPQTGFTSPLWIIVQAPMQAAVGALGLPPAIGAKALSWLFGLLAAYAAGSIARGLTGSSYAAAATGLMLLFNPGFALSMQSGMEITLTALLVLLTLRFWQQGQPLACGIAAALAMLARPEAAVVIPLLLLPSLARSARGERLGTAVALLAPSALLGALWVGYNWMISGRPLPTTFYVKGSLGGGNWLAEALAYWPQWLLQHGVDALVVGGLLILLGVVVLVRRGHGLFALALGLLVIGSVLAIDLSRRLDLGFYTTRYLYPFTALMSIPAGVAIWWLWTWLSDLLPTRRSAVAVILLLLAVAPLIGDWIFTARLYGDSCRQTRQLHTEPSKKLPELTPENAVVAVEGAGAAAYFGKREIVDLVGLNDHALTAAVDAISKTRPEMAPLKRLCVLAERGVTHVYLPNQLLPLVSSGFQLRELYRTSVTRWAITGYKQPRSVGIYEAKPLPALHGTCTKEFGDSR